MFRIGYDQGRLFLTSDFLARDTCEGKVPGQRSQAAPDKKLRFQPIEDLVTALDSMAAAANAA